MRYLSTVYVRDHRARVQHRQGSLLVSSAEGSQRIPLEAIDAVVMLGSAQITTQALEACVRRGVRVTALRTGGGGRCHRFKQPCSHAICAVICQRIHRSSCPETWTSS